MDRYRDIITPENNRTLNHTSNGFNSEIQERGGWMDVSEGQVGGVREGEIRKEGRREGESDRNRVRSM